MRERALGRGAGPHDAPERDWGWIDVTAIQLEPPDAPSIDLTPRARFVAPDDGNAEDRTVMAVPLDFAVAPGQIAESGPDISAIDPTTRNVTSSFNLANLSPHVTEGPRYYVSLRAVALTGLKSAFSPPVSFSF